MSGGFFVTNRSDGKSFAFDATYVAWAAQSLKVEEEGYPGTGKEISPFRMRTIGQWAKAAATSTQKGADLYLIGGHIIERNPPGEYGDYTTDVVEPYKGLGEFPNKTSTADRPRSFPAPNRSDPKPVYRLKFERILANLTEFDDVRVARQMRELLKGDQRLAVIESFELPGTVAAMFLSEVKRAPIMLPIGLMLLDLIEKEVVHGSAPTEIYTVEKMMSDPEKPEDRVSGGMHPMMHDRSINESKTMFEAMNLVTSKVVSILTSWLFTYIHDNPIYTIELLDTIDETRKTRAKAKEPELKSPINKFLTAYDQNLVKDPEIARNQFYTDLIKPALERRCATLDCLL